MMRHQWKGGESCWAGGRFGIVAYELLPDHVLVDFDDLGWRVVRGEDLAVPDAVPPVGEVQSEKGVRGPGNSR